MMNKRKREDTSAAAASENKRAKKQRIRKRSNSEPLRTESVPVEKGQALRRLFGRISAIDMERNQRPASGAEVNQLPASGPEGNQRSASDPEVHVLTEADENSLVEDVPADMDPEQLGFLVCAQETLRFLNAFGITYQHPAFNNLRLRLLRGINEIGVA